MSYKQQLLADLEKGHSVTVISGFERYGCLNIRKPVLDLRREGHRIITQMNTAPSGKRYACYYLHREELV